MKRILLFVFLSSLLLSCGPESYKYTDSIVGEWSAKSITINGKSYRMTEYPFVFTFGEDLKYTLNSELFKVSTNNRFDSDPFRGEGNYFGDYAIVSDDFLRIKEKYRDNYTFTDVNIKDGELILSSGTIKIILTKNQINE